MRKVKFLDQIYDETEEKRRVAGEEKTFSSLWLASFVFPCPIVIFIQNIYTMPIKNVFLCSFSAILLKFESRLCAKRALTRPIYEVQI